MFPYPFQSSEWENEEESLAEELCGRVSYVKSFASGDMNDQAQRVWKKQREDRILIDHLFRTGNYKTALVLTKDADLEVYYYYYYIYVRTVYQVFPGLVPYRRFIIYYREGVACRKWYIRLFICIKMKQYVIQF